MNPYITVISWTWSLKNVKKRQTINNKKICFVDSFHFSILKLDSPELFEKKSKHLILTFASWSVGGLSLQLNYLIGSCGKIFHRLFGTTTPWPTTPLTPFPSPPPKPPPTLDLPTTFTEWKMSDVKKSNNLTMEEVHKKIINWHQYVLTSLCEFFENPLNPPPPQTTTNPGPAHHIYWVKDVRCQKVKQFDYGAGSQKK